MASSRLRIPSRILHNEQRTTRHEYPSLVAVQDALRYHKTDYSRSNRKRHTILSVRPSLGEPTCATQHTGSSLFLNQSYTLDIITIAQRYAVRKIKNVKSEDLPGRAHYVEARSWYPVLTNEEMEIALGSTPEPLQAHTPTTGKTRHSSSIYSTASGSNYIPIFLSRNL